MDNEPALLTELDSLAAAIRGYDDPRRAAAEWKQAFRLLQKTDLPAVRVGHVVGMRDVEGFAALIQQLRDPAAAEEAAGETPDPELCRRALKAFRKRLSLTVLDEQSKLGRGPLSKGAKAKDSAAIAPPAEYPGAVWAELTRQGKLKYIGNGLYELGKA